MTSSALKKAVRTQLLPWFTRHKRAMPWRRNRTPYRVWIAELMLQQTRVDQVDPYYRRFMKAFPSLKRLAGASRAEVLKLWEGLGYYARAHRLHETAQQLVDEKKGRFPASYEGLLALPGVGPYTASAVGSLAFNLDLAVLDGNVIRVLSRLHGYGQDTGTSRAKHRLQGWADELLPPGRAADYNEAVMELGALVCTPRNPRCDQCPLRKVCVALEKGRPEAYPVKKKKKRVPHKVVGAAVVTRQDGRVLIAQRREKAMLGGLWEFPGGTLEKGESMRACIRRELKEELGIQVKVGAHLLTVRHAYSHFTIAMDVHWATLEKGRPRTIECADFAWVTVKELDAYAFSKADLAVVDYLKTNGANGGRHPSE